MSPSRRAFLLGAAALSAAVATPEMVRAAAAMDAALAAIPGPLILAIGNAPTALLRLLKHLDAGGPPPALVIGMPVGFVNAAESKALLMTRADVPWIAIAGRKGGSALAGATVNALAILAGAETA